MPTLPPSRDAFGLALAAVRRRLRLGVDSPGAALPIKSIAADLRLSTTPVREAMSRLVGEDLIDKAGANYVRPRLDAEELAELYDLRRLYLVAALARRDRRAFRPADLATAGALPGLADLPEATAMTAGIFERVMRGADNLALTHAYLRVAERLAPITLSEAQVFSDLREEAGALAACAATGGASLLRAVKRYHRRRVLAAPAIARQVAGRYRSNII